MPKLVSDTADVDCKLVFEWETNQVCSNKKFQSLNEIPCYLTQSASLDQVAVNKKKTSLIKYVQVDLNPLQLTDNINATSTLSYSSSSLHKVIEYDESLDISLNVCRYGNALDDKCPGTYAACVSNANGSYAAFGFDSSTTKLSRAGVAKYQLVYDLLQASPSLQSCSTKNSKMTVNFICPSSRSGVSLASSK